MSRSSAMYTLAILLTMLTQIGCERSSVADLNSDANEPLNQAADSVDFTEQVLAATGSYLKYSMPTPFTTMAPTMCAAPTEPLAAKLSQSEDADSHGRKIYYLFAKDAKDYNLGKGDAPVGQVIVKESWVAREEESPKASWQKHASGNEVNPVARHDGKSYIAGEKGPLFAMLKLAPDTAGTDNGWVYATLSPDGSQVTAAGKLQNCMECHVEATRDRLFGLHYSP